MERRYPVGIQTFSEIIRERYIYVDKTDLMWKMQQVSKYIFLSRPRRFGKSLLSSTLHSFFEGRKDLFKGLKVMELEKEWNTYPVIHLDLSMAKNMTTMEMLRSQLMYILKPYSSLYGIDPEEDLPGKRLAGLIRRAFEQTGKQVVVIIDEYDAPLLDVMHKEDIHDFRQVMQEFYQTLKPYESMIRFCFITGITKFSQLSIFSTINNLTNVSMDPRFSAICGITEKELTTTLSEDIKTLADSYGFSADRMHEILKQKYDGYHFSESSPEIYNPLSLMKAFLHRKVANYWFETGTPTFLIRQMQYFYTDITSMEHIETAATAFDCPTEGMTDALPLLYQSGYLTIKEYDPEEDVYTLSIPNQEVRVGLTDGLMPAYTGIRGSDVHIGFALKFWRALKKDNIELALTEMKAYFAGLPYIEGFKKKLQEVATVEGFYEYTMYLIFSMLNVFVRTQVKCSGGRADMVVHMPNTTYVLELKINGTAQQALDQINSHGYAIPYQTEDKYVVKVGIRFSTESKNIEDWVVEQS
ncbi:MAG: AAA family ATPase [Prevotella sp.]|nr:AAA family ATPase [Prevotella sp.]